MFVGGLRSISLGMDEDTSKSFAADDDADANSDDDDNDINSDDDDDNYCVGLCIDCR